MVEASLPERLRPGWKEAGAPGSFAEVTCRPECEAAPGDGDGRRGLWGAGVFGGGTWKGAGSGGGGGGLGPESLEERREGERGILSREEWSGTAVGERAL